MAQGLAEGLPHVVSHRVQYHAHPCLTFSSMTWMKGRCFLILFIDDTKLGGVASTPECCATLQRDRLERWAERNLLKFSKGKCRRFLRVWKNNPVSHSTGWRLTCWEAALQRKTWGCGQEAGHEPAVCLGGQVASGVLGCIRKSIASRVREVRLHSAW